MAFSQPTAWMPGAAGASNSGQQGSYFPMQALPPQSNSAGNNLPATASVAAISKERQERYKMEQQRKFKNMGEVSRALIVFKNFIVLLSCLFQMGNFFKRFCKNLPFKPGLGN